MSTDPRLQRLLGGEALAALRQRLRRHFERTAADAAAGTFRLGALAEHEQACLASLMGRAWRGAGSMQIDLRAIDTALQRAGIAATLRDALEQLDGAIEHKATLRAQARSQWAAVAAGARHPALAAWLQTAPGLGLLKRLARQDARAATGLRERADAVLQRLPAGGLPRAQLAALALGDAHALDAGQPAATLVLAAWRRHDPAPDLDPADGADAADTADAGDGGATGDIGDTGDAAPDVLREDSAREVWARAGVLVNELARPALFLNLPTHAGTPAVGAPGEPAYASLRALLRTPPAWAVAGREVFVCENPNLLAIAADRLGAHCAPLVCTDGMPAAAQRTLLGQLARAGARLRYHGDFDWAGLQIANQVLRACSALPWRMAAADYEAAIAAATGHIHPLAGNAVRASWDSALAPAMQRSGQALAEEGQAELLLADLQCGPGCRERPQSPGQ